jgi:hypothetical protein
MNHAHVEFCHFYSDQEFGTEHADSINILLDVTRDFRLKDVDFVTSILIDDVNVEENKHGYNYVLDRVKLYGTRPNFVAFESRFTEVAEKIITLLPPSKITLEKFKQDDKSVLFFNSDGKKFALNDIYEDHKVFKCVTLSAAWLLCKLGLIKFPHNSYIDITVGADISAEKIISILPKKYQQVEENVLDIVSALGYESELHRIQHIFY